MGLTKAEPFTRSQNDLAAMAKAIAHPARIAILQHLVNLNACICVDPVEELGLAQAFALTPNFTGCLAQHACGIPDKKKASLAELPVSPSSSCTPGGGCC